ncbi:MAG: hypothetical protein JWN70_4341 [Planctomycetaceae bacterium]|nr:hypothetical protein [Planctomycetaceae bacterium]
MSRKLLVIMSVLAAMFCVTFDSSTAEAGRYVVRSGYRGGYVGYRGGWRSGWRPAYRWGNSSPYYGGYYY